MSNTKPDAQIAAIINPPTIAEYIAQFGEQELYSCGHGWIGRDGNQLVYFPAILNGWDQRQTTSKRPKQADLVSITNAIGTGYPRWERGLAPVIAQRVRQARCRAGMSQAELAERLEKPKQRVNELEDAQNLPRADTLRALAVSLGVSSDWLLGLSD